MIPRQESIVGYWPGNLNDSDELHDIIGGNNGTLAGTPDQVSTPFGDALDYNGTTDYVDAGVSINLSNNDFTISTLAKFGIDDADYVMSQTHTQLPSYSSDWILCRNHVIFWMRGESLGTLSDYEDNLWHHFVAIWDRSVEKYMLYVDGVSLGQSANVSDYGGVGTIKIGTRGDATSAFFKGIIAHTIIRNAALDADEVKQEFRALMRLPAGR